MKTIEEKIRQIAEKTQIPAEAIHTEITDIATKNNTDKDTALCIWKARHWIDITQPTKKTTAKIYHIEKRTIKTPTGEDQTYTTYHLITKKPDNTYETITAAGNNIDVEEGREYIITYRQQTPTRIRIQKTEPAEIETLPSIEECIQHIKKITTKEIKNHNNTSQHIKGTVVRLFTYGQNMTGFEITDEDLDSPIATVFPAEDINLNWLMVGTTVTVYGRIRANQLTDKPTINALKIYGE